MSTDTTLPDIAVAFRRSLARLSRRLRLERRDRSVSSGKLSVLGHLYRQGAMTPGALAEAEGIQPQSLTRLLADLEAAGFALRRPDPVDRRQSLIEITPAGRDLLHRDAAERAAWLAAAMAAHLSPTERELLRLAAQLMDRLADAAPAEIDSIG